MKKTGVIVCSNSGLDYIEHPYDVPVFRSVVIFGDEEKYDDYIEIKAEDFYNRLKNDNKAFPHTAFVSPGKMEEIFDDMASKGYERVIVIHISNELSSLGKTINILAEDYDKLEIISYDSQTIAYPQALMALTACKMIEDGYDIDKIIEQLDYIKNHNHMIFAVETLEYLIKNGRLSKFAGTIGQFLAIKPLLHLNKDGKVETLEKIRTSKKARERMLEMFIDEIKDKNVIPFIIHANADENVISYLNDRVVEAYPQYIKLNVYPLTPVVGAHAGPGTVCLGYIEKDNLYLNK